MTPAPDIAGLANTVVVSSVLQEAGKTPESNTARDALAYAKSVTESEPSFSGAASAKLIAANIEPEAVSKSAPQTRSKPEPAARERNTRHAYRTPQIMILRTIEFADGHRETRLLPYRGRRQDFTMERKD